MKPWMLVPIAALAACSATLRLRTETLAKEVFTKAPWQTDYDAARGQAKQLRKLLFAYFTRSYAA